MISRTDPRIPGTSRWLLPIDRILDQQPGIISVQIISLDDLPLARASLRQDFLRRSRKWRYQIQEFSDQASDRLEGWLEEQPWEQKESLYRKSHFSDKESDILEDWSEPNIEKNNYNTYYYDSDLSSSSSEPSTNEEDPWI